MSQTDYHHNTPSDDLLSQRLYWMNKLSGNLPEAPLFRESARPLSDVGGFEDFDFDLPAEAAEKLIKLTKGSELSIYVALAAAFTVFAYKYSRNEDIIIGSPLYKAGDSKNILVPLRTKVRGDSTFRDCLLDMKQTVLEAYSNQDYPFEKILHLLGITQGHDRLSILDVVISSAGIHETRDLSSLDIPLTLIFTCRGESVSGVARYKTALFHDQTIKRIVSRYLVVCDWLLQNVTSNISEASLITDQERKQLVFDYNETSRPYPLDRSFRQLFAQQVNASPDPIAVTSSAGSLSYSHLKARSDLLASSLRSLGLGPEHIVALYCRRDLDFLTSVIGVLEAGAAYLPLDPNLPATRLTRILAGSGCSLILISSELLEGASDLLWQLQQALEEQQAEQYPQVMTIEELTRRNGDSASDSGAISSEAENLAYIIYTSGSTGEPKGVMVEQRGMVNHLFAKVEGLAVSHHDIIAQTATQSFDISVWQMLCGLVVGAKVVIADDEEAKDPRRMVEMISREEVTIAETVPTMLQAVMREDEAAAGRMRSLRWMIATGEELKVEVSRRWNRQMGGIKLMNAYGPTECSDDVTQGEVREEEGSDRTTIGRAIGNMRLYVVDEERQEVGEGMEGELYVGGVGVGRGYKGEGGKTGESYVGDWISGREGERLYRTGDVVRRRRGGELEYVGRRDQQVKMRGYRIELGEIEREMMKEEGVREAVVEMREVEGGEKRLVGYVEMEGSREVGGWEIRGRLRERMAEYMVPSVIVVMEKMPLNANGKIDRKRLPEAGRERGEEAGVYVAPRDPIEEEAAGYFCQVLGIDKVSIHDDFFQLGGHSLAAMQLVTLVREAFSIDLPLRQFFTKATVEQLARVIEEMMMQQVEGLTDEQAQQLLDEQV
jgi:amino acid adenylation domain-containing protein